MDIYGPVCAELCDAGTDLRALMVKPAPYFFRVENENCRDCNDGHAPDRGYHCVRAGLRCALGEMEEGQGGGSCRKDDDYYENFFGFTRKTNIVRAVAWIKEECRRNIDEGDGNTKKECQQGEGRSCAGGTFVPAEERDNCDEECRKEEGVCRFERGVFRH